MDRMVSILLVDDEKTVLRVTERLLTKKGYRVVTADNYESAMEHFKNETFDLLITDHLMPGKTGLELILEVKKNNSSMINILMTGVGDRNLYREAINKAAVFSVIEKPYDTKVFIETVTKALDVYEKRSREIIETQELKEQYHTIFDNTTDLIQCTAEDGKIIYVNPMWHNLIGYDDDRIKSMNTIDLIKEEYRIAFNDIHGRIKAGKKIKTFETVFISETGAEVFLEGNAFLQYREGKIAAVIFIFRDVTEKIKSASEIRERLKQETMVARIAKLLAQVEEPFDAFPDILRIIGTYNGIDRAVLRLIDYKREEYISIAVWEMESSEKREHLPSHIPFSEIPNIHKCIQNLDVFSFYKLDMLPYPEREIAEKKMLGSFIIFPVNVGYCNVGALFIESRTKMEPWTDSETAILKSAIDIIANGWKRQLEMDFRKEKERDAEQSKMLVIRADRLAALGTMTAGIIHEITQPLNAISVSAQTILYGMSKGWEIDPDQIKNSLTLVVDQIKRMQQIIVSMRAFARDGHLAPKEKGNINELIKQIFTLISEQMRVHEIELKSDFGILPDILLNSQQISQVILNILSNAREALDEKAMSGKIIKVKTCVEKNEINIEISDNATGIPLDIIEKIFDPFYTTKEVGKGTGLGLAISSRIMNEHGGALDVYNNDMGGATFVIKLPL